MKKKSQNYTLISIFTSKFIRFLEFEFHIRKFSLILQHQMAYALWFVNSIFYTRSNEF